LPANRTTSGTYDQVALAYEERIVPYYRDIAKMLVSLANPGKGTRILDVGAGTGIVARMAEPSLRPNGIVVLLDKAAPMLAIARQRMPRMGGAAACVCLVEESESMSLDSDQFDSVLGQFSYVEESPKAVREVFRVLGHGGSSVSGRLPLAHDAGPLVLAGLPSGSAHRGPSVPGSPRASEHPTQRHFYHGSSPAIGTRAKIPAE
jgi:ubiquinone/menaquinone biosynthesis C-methylase UbiE